MSKNINVEEIWSKHYMNHQDNRDNEMSRRAAIKEIVEAVIDKCAKEVLVTVVYEDGKEDAHLHIDPDFIAKPNRESILKVKQMIDYE